MNELPARLKDLGDYLNVDWDQQDVEPALVALHQTAARRRRRRTVGAVTLAAVVAVATVYVAGKPRSGDTRPSSAQLAAAARDRGTKRDIRVAAKPEVPQQPGRSATGHTVALPDGSRYRTLARRSRLEIRQVSAERVHLVLAAGAAQFEVAKRATRSFHVSAGGVEVVVLGTTFTVQRESSPTGEQALKRVRVAVEEGRVRVLWREREVLLGTGDSRWFAQSRSSGRATRAKRPTVRSPSRTGKAGVAPSAPTWRQLADQGRYVEAHQLLTSAGSSAADQVRDEPRDLFLAADSARLAEQPRRALPYLRQIVDRHPNDGRAPLAAFTIGRLHLSLGSPLKAAAAFARARKLDNRGPLAEDALAREAEAWKQADRPAAARKRAELYLRDYPAGRHAESVRRWGQIDR